MKNGVKPVDRFGVVLMLHNTGGNSSTQQPGVRCKGTRSRGLIPLKISLLALSACPLDCGCATDETSRRMCSRSQNSFMAPLDKLVPLSVMMLCGKPNRKNYFLDELNRGGRVTLAHWFCLHPLCEFINCHQEVG